MLRMLHDKNLSGAFNVSEEETSIILELTKQMTNNTGIGCLSKVIERYWIDERLSDNARALAIFTLGYTYALQTERRNTWKK